MTTALTTGYAIPIPPLATGGVTDGYATLMQEADDHIKGDVNSLSGIVTTLSGSLTTTSGYLTTLSGSLTTLSGNVTTLSGNVTTLSASLTTTSGYVTTLSGGVSTLSNYITTAWVDYAATSTIVGWDDGTFTTKVLKYKKMGTVILVLYYLDGTSDSSDTTFTLPYNSLYDVYGSIPKVLNSGAAEAVGKSLVQAASNVVTLFRSAGAWSNSGNKLTAGQFFYEAAL